MEGLYECLMGSQCSGRAPFIGLAGATRWHVVQSLPNSRHELALGPPFAPDSIGHEMDRTLALQCARLRRHEARAGLCAWRAPKFDHIDSHILLGTQNTRRPSAPFGYNIDARARDRCIAAATRRGSARAHERKAAGR